ncbi:uncharacterized protein LOC113507326 [Trichoplusia ni]|uniref:Uncharacterized protein LOC113507326 n=1 Tax=Trichoplusia ni TaxID=7111 RepID=A0A7E5X0P2_TRINI|nr:uncharacterized protein LOC113507326 [Trichoplusia ni]
MKIQSVSGRGAGGEPPRSTAYYYADLERNKRRPGPDPEARSEDSELPDTSPVADDGAIREVPPLRDRGRQWSLPEYSTPENSRKIEETYSTAGTFPMPEHKEKEPLLAELAVVGRVPLTQLEGPACAGAGRGAVVRRTRSWYLCCPNVADDEVSRESSWRYSSLRPVTAPPLPGTNGHRRVGTHSPAREDPNALRAERDALARALAAERQRAATAARAHDARLAELHGVIAELVRRRAHDKQTRAIPEEDVSDECESTTQPAGELDNDADNSRTDQSVDMAYQQEASDQQDVFKTDPAEQPDADLPDRAGQPDGNEQDGNREGFREMWNGRDRRYGPDTVFSHYDTETELDSGRLPDYKRRSIDEDSAYPQVYAVGTYDDSPLAASPELPTPQAEPSTQNDVTSEVESIPQDYRAESEGPRVEVTTPSAGDGYDASLQLSGRDSDAGRATARYYTESGGSCERERGSPDSPRLYSSAERIEARQAKLASRVRLRKTEDTDNSTSPTEQAAKSSLHQVHEALELMEAQHGSHDAGPGGCAWAARALRLRAERRVLRCALARAADTARRLYCACALHESSCVSLCCALRAADRALEVYDVLLALAETHGKHSQEREAAELVARQLLARLDEEHSSASIGEPLLSPGPWLQHHAQPPSSAWTAGCERRLRAHAARLKADTVALRDTQPQPKLFSYHDIDESELGPSGPCSSAEMEEAVAIHDALILPHARSHNTHNSHGTHGSHSTHNTHGTQGAQPALGGSSSTLGKKETHEEKRGSSGRPRRSRPRHWLDARASETDL